MMRSYFELSETVIVEIIDRKPHISLWSSNRTKNIEDLENSEADEALNIDLDLYQLEEDF